MPRAKKPVVVLRDNSPQPPSHVEPALEIVDGKARLDLKKALCTKKADLKFLVKTEAQLVFQILGSGSVLTTDHYGYIGLVQKVFNGTPSDFVRASKNQFLPGEIVYVVRPMTRGRKVFSGRVVSIEENKNVVVDLNDRDFFPMTSRRKYGDTSYGIFPPGMLHKSSESILDYAHGILADLKVAETQYRQMLEDSAQKKNG